MFLSYHYSPETRAVSKRCILKNHMGFALIMELIHLHSVFLTFLNIFFINFESLI